MLPSPRCACTANPPCQEALDWIASLGDIEPATAWESCPRADWMIWHLRASGRGTHREWVRLSVAMARSVLHLVAEGEDRPAAAVDTVDRWLAGDATIEEVRVAAVDARATANRATSFVASFAVLAAVVAAYAARAAGAGAGGADDRALADLVRAIFAPPEAT